MNSAYIGSKLNAAWFHISSSMVCLIAFVDEDLFCVLNKRESFMYRAGAFSIGSFFSFVPLTSSLFNIHNWILLIFL